MKEIYDDELFKSRSTVTPELNSHLKKLADKAESDAFMDRVMLRTADIFNAVIADNHNRYVEANKSIDVIGDLKKTLHELTDEELDAMDAELEESIAESRKPREWTAEDQANFDEIMQSFAETKAKDAEEIQRNGATADSIETLVGAGYVQPATTVYSDNTAMFENPTENGVFGGYIIPPAPTFYPNSIPELPNSTIPIITTTTTVPPFPATEVKDSNPKDAVGIKKIAFSTVPSTVIAEVAVGMTEGARKYGRHNYRAVGVRYSVYYDATLRHLMKWWEGEDIDPDSGLSHVTKAITSLVVLRDAMINGMVTDDRPPRIPEGFWEDVQKQVDVVFRKYPDSVKPFVEGDQY